MMAHRGRAGCGLEMRALLAGQENVADLLEVVQSVSAENQEAEFGGGSNACLGDHRGWKISLRRSDKPGSQPFKPLILRLKAIGRSG